jgi:lysophospholipase
MNGPDPSACPAAVPDGLPSTYRPADACGFLPSRGARLRYACWNAPGTARGSVVLVQGRAEFIEKYAMEVVGEFLARGFAVWAADLAGQGLSSRPLQDHDKGHIDDFATYVADLGLFVQSVVAPAAPRPLVLLCHSTGGQVGLRYLAERGRGPFAAALFTSPMTGLPKAWLIRTALALFRLLPGADTRYAPRTGPYDPAGRDFAKNDVTHDERRYRFSDRWFASDPRLKLGGPTVGWLHQALRSFKVLDAPGVLERIDLPVLVLTAGEDTVVDTSTHAKLVARIKGARHLAIAGSRHEIMMETDAIRAQFWQAFDRLAKDILP